MKEINFLDLIKKSFWMTFKNKVMLFFGFLAFIGSFTSTFKNADSKQSENVIFQYIQNFHLAHPLLSAFIGLILVFVLAALYLLKLNATASLIKIANNFEVYKQSQIKPIFNESTQFIWRLFGMEIMIALSAFILIALIITPISYLFSNNSKVLALIFLFFGLLIIISILVLAYYIIRFGEIYLVLGNTKIKKSLESAYELFEKNFKASIYMGLTSFALNIVFLITLIIIVFLIAIILAIIGFLLYLAFSNQIINFIIIIGSVITIIALLVLFSWFTAFMQSLWVLFFQQISLESKKEKEEEKEKIDAEIIIPDPEAV